ncbi:MAG: hypothetical protein C5B53_00140 [Candidatus Melainabacteria bacterium]|nr:MAG: hypothetical protein C5B53_00140 [Candidatus Melainabacteria bacterium]
MNQSQETSFLKRVGHLEKPQQLEIVACLGIFLFSLYVCWLFSLAYPQSFITEETACHRALSHSFTLFEANSLDWSITFPFSLVLWLSAHSPCPSSATYWLNVFLLSLSMAVVVKLGRALFGSLLAGLGLALSAIAFELAVMRIFYSNLQVCVDPLLSELVCLGILLSLVAWLDKRPRLFIAAYAVLGWACFLKPVGLSLLPMLVPLAILAWYRLPEKHQKIQVFALSLCLLLAPPFLWSLRNFFIYHEFKCSALAGSSLLRVVLPLVEQGDVVLGNPSLDQTFILSVRTCEIVGKYPREIDLPQPIRSWRNEEYFISGNCPVNPFVFLANTFYPGWNASGSRYNTPTLEPPVLFKLDAICGPMALRIIWAHPLGYLHRVAREYVDLFNPAVLMLDPWDKFYGEPPEDYMYWKPRVGPRPIDFELNPVTGIPSGLHSNATVAKAFRGLYYNPVVAQFREWYFANELVISHLIFLGALALLIYRYSLKNVRDCAIVLVVLFLSSDLTDVAVSMCQVAKARYALCGEIELHLAFLISVFAIAHWLVLLTKRTPAFSIPRLLDIANQGNLPGSVQQSKSETD